MPATENTDYSHKTYSTHAGFVPLLTQKVTQLLSPQPNDKIIDLGAGDLVLTAKLAPLVSSILAIDASAQLLTSGRSLFPESTYPNLQTKVLDCRYLEQDTGICDGSWDKVFSNAALHWILCDPSTRAGVFRGVNKCLKQGGKFVAEMGGFGNIGEVHAAIVGALLGRGVELGKIRDANPWCFPSVGYAKGLLEESGFKVGEIELEYRPTELSEEAGDGEDKDGGVKAWIQMFGSKFLELVEEGVRGDVAGEARDILEGIARREDGRWVVGYVRLRWVATKI